MVVLEEQPLLVQCFSRLRRLLLRTPELLLQMRLTQEILCSSRLQMAIAAVNKHA